MISTKYNIESFTYGKYEEAVREALNEWMHRREQVLGGPERKLGGRFSHQS